MRKMLSEPRAPSVIFYVGTGEEKVRVPAHRDILAARSPYFEELLFGAFEEARTDKPVELTDVSPFAFKNVIKYCYVAEADLNGDNVMETLNLARMYCIGGLKRMCLGWAGDHLTIDTCCEMLSAALAAEEPTLAEKCRFFVKKNFAAALVTDGFGSLPFSEVKALLEDDTLPADEVVCFVVFVSRALNGL